MSGKKKGAPPKKGPNSQGIDAPVKTILEPETLEMIDSFQNDRTIGLPEEAYEQEDQTIRDVPGKVKGGMSSCPNRPDGIRGQGAAIKGSKFVGVK